MTVQKISGLEDALLVSLSRSANSNPYTTILGVER